MHGTWDAWWRCAFFTWLILTFLAIPRGGIAYAWDPALCDQLLPSFSEDIIFLDLVTCHDLRAALHRAFNAWSANHEYIRCKWLTAASCNDTARWASFLDVLCGAGVEYDTIGSYRAPLRAPPRAPRTILHTCTMHSAPHTTHTTSRTAH